MAKNKQEKEIVKLIHRSGRYINQNHISAFYNNNSIIVILYNYISYYIPEPGYLSLFELQMCK